MLSQSTDADRAMPLPPAGGDSGLVSEELLHRAIRSNVDLAETLGSLVREMNLGLSSILSHAVLATSYGDEARRATALGNLQQEAARLRQVLNQLGDGPAAPAAAPSRPPRRRPFASAPRLSPLLPRSVPSPPARARLPRRRPPWPPRPRPSTP